MIDLHRRNPINQQFYEANLFYLEKATEADKP